MLGNPRSGMRFTVLLVKNMKKPGQPDREIHDSGDDTKHLQREETTLDLPDVEDIPGQEHVKPPVFGEWADTTASSADEEGDEIFDQESDSENTSNVSRSERELLSRSARQTPGDESEMDVRSASLDRKDNDGEPLNEGDLLTDRFGEDLDLPESEEVDEEDSE
jgi:hypothetical protein